MYDKNQIKGARKVGNNISDSTSIVIPTVLMHHKGTSKSTRIDADNIFSKSFDLDHDRKVGKNIFDSTSRVIQTVSMHHIESTKSPRIVKIIFFQHRLI